MPERYLDLERLQKGSAMRRKVRTVPRKAQRAKQRPREDPEKPISPEPRDAQIGPDRRR